MFRVFSGETADDVWRDAATELLSTSKVVHVQQGRNGTARELLHAAITVRNPQQRWVSSRNPVISPAFALAEVVWILAGRNDAATINYFNKRLPEYAGFGHTYHGAYGFRLRKHFDSIDQLHRAYLALKSQPASRQVLLQIWDARCDLPLTDGLPRAQDIPCNVLSMLNIRDGRLDWTQIIRSNDIFLGLPHNLVQFTTLHEVMAGWLGVELGSYNQLSNSLHLYEKDLRDDMIYTQPKIQSTDLLNLPKSISDIGFEILSNNLDQIANPHTTVAELLNMAQNSTLPSPLRNMLFVLCSEGARRRHCINAAKELAQRCTNPAMSSLTACWIDRWNSGRED